MENASIDASGTTPALAAKRELLKKAARRNHAAPIRRSFVQQGELGHPRPGPLAAFVHNHDMLALDLLLLMYAAASHPPYAVHLRAAVWARLLRYSRLRKPAPLSPLGYTVEYRYRRQPPFGPGRPGTP